jgi:dCTP deaminase
MSSPVDRPYGSAGLGSKYQGQSEPTASAYFEDFERGRRGTAASKPPAR